MIMVGPRLPWLAVGASHKPNSAKDSVQSHASAFCKEIQQKKVSNHMYQPCVTYFIDAPKKINGRPIY